VIALVATLLVAIYALGPDLVARWILGFVVPRKSLVQTRSEEITRGILWSILPLSIAWSLRHFGPLSLAPNSRIDLQMFFSGLYSESFFNQNRQSFFTAADSFINFNVCLMVRLYSIVIIFSLTFNVLIGKYGVMRNWFASRSGLSWMRPVLSTIILPRISEWHVTLSPILLPSKDMNIEVDVLTKSGTLYQGALSDKIIAADGSLESLTLSNPRRFKRDQYLDDMKNQEKVKAEDYWKTIPGNLFVILEHDISTFNVRHIPGSVRRFSEEFKDIAEAMKDIQAKLLELQRKKSGAPGPSASPTGN
jgi:hypothetical protein